VYQAVFDHRQAAAISTNEPDRKSGTPPPRVEEQDVRIGDLLFSHKHSAGNCRHAKARIGGLVAAVSPFLAHDIRGEVPPTARHAGIAVTTFSHKVNRPEERVVVQCGGLATIDVDDMVCTGDILVCHAPKNICKGARKRCRATAQRCLVADLRSGASRHPILGRCLTNGRPGGTVDVILSANAPGLLWF
jgi:hypothetical protein